MKTTGRFRVIISSKGKKKSIEIDQDSCVLGRASGADIVLDEDLISRQHIKISLQNEKIIVEELGSSNGSWFNGNKMKAGEKVVYTIGSVLKLGSAEGITLAIEDLRETANVVALSSDPERTLVHDISLLQNATEERKVANGSSERAVITPKIPVQSSRPEIKKEVTTEAKKTIKLVEAPVEKPISSPAEKTALTKVSTLKKSASDPKNDPKKSFEDQVKQLINHEAEILRANSSKDAEKIRLKAIEEQDNILHSAQEQSRKIIEDSEKAAAKTKQDADLYLQSIQEKIKTLETQSVESLRETKENLAQEEERIKALRKEESLHLKRMKSLEEDHHLIKERIRNDHALIEELKFQVAAQRKGAELRAEEFALEERRSRAKIETEMIEARSQVAKILAEADKAQLQKEMIVPEVQQLKNDKDKIERDINEAQISLRRVEYDIELLNKKQFEIDQHTQMATSELERIVANTQEYKNKYKAIEDALNSREENLQFQIDSLHASAEKIIEEAKSESARIQMDAQVKIESAHKHRNDILRELDNYKKKFHADLLVERQEADKAMHALKETRTKELHEEMASLKTQFQGDIVKLDQKKKTIIDETKWIEESCKKKCETLVQDAEAQASLHRKNANLDVEKIKAQVLEEIDSFKKKVLLEAQAIKQKALEDVAVFKNETANQCQAMKHKTQQSIAQSEAEIAEEKEKLKALINDNEVALKKYQDATTKTESLMDERFLRNEEKIKTLLEGARKEAARLEQDGHDKKAEIIASIDREEKSAEERLAIEKVRIHEFQILNLQNTANAIAAAVEDYVSKELSKSRNLMVEDKLVGKIATRTSKMVSDVIHGRYETPVVMPTPGMKKQQSQKIQISWGSLLRGILIYAFLFALLAVIGLYFYDSTIIHKFMATNNITIPDGVFAFFDKLIG